MGCEVEGANKHLHTWEFITFYCNVEKENDDIIKKDPLSNRNKTMTTKRALQRRYHKSHLVPYTEHLSCPTKHSLSPSNAVV